MKFFLFISLIVNLAQAGDFTVIDGEISSPLMGKPVPYWAIIPENPAPGPIPVVYFLHGRGGNRFQFRDVLGEKVLREKGKNFAVVALTGRFLDHDTYWVNDVQDKKFPWRDVVLKELIPAIEKKHSLGGTREKRLIAGISMGSHGAFQIALTSGLFRCVAGHSLVVRDFKSMSQEFPGKFGDEEEFKKRDPLSLLGLYKKRSELPMAKYWVDIGGSDNTMFIERARLVEKELIRLGVQAQDSIDIGKSDPEGKHDYPYWMRHMPSYIDWYASCFDL